MNDIKLIEFLHNNVKICMGKFYTYTTQGVPQGLITSPLLFNVIADDLLAELEKAQLSAYMFADDLAIVCKNHKDLLRAIRIVEQWAQNNNFKINKQKSGIMIICKKQIKCPVQIQQYPVVNQYRYLGTTMDNKLSIAGHLQNLRNRFNILAVKFKNLRNKKDIMTNINLFRVFAIRMHLPSVEGQGQTLNKKIISEAIQKNVHAKSHYPKQNSIYINWRPTSLFNEMKFMTQLKAQCHIENNTVDSSYLQYLRQPKAVKKLPKKSLLMINLSTRICPQHRKPCSDAHLKYHHGSKQLDLVELLIKYQYQPEKTKKRISGVIRRLKKICKQK